ncbi:MAG: gamma-glutamyltransferase family protein [Spirochaetia bacterium]|nr:gamma-glutamyltransferase family protein [Spirochaetia bacterium]
MNFNPDSREYPSARSVVYARNGMVCTGQPLAAQAGLDVLKRGGNAVDAAVATAAALTVLEPTANGIGGDAFALVWKDGRLYGLNASGPAPKALSLAALARQDPPLIAKHGWEPVTVPGAPSAWFALSRRFGALPFADLLEAAVRYARDGYPVSPVCARYWGKAHAAYSVALKDDMFREWFRVFAPAGHAPRAGSLWSSPEHAATLAELADTACESFYRGRVAGVIDAHSRATGGFLRASDLAAFQPEWVEPVGVDFMGHRVWEIPPNGQGLVALMALAMLDADNLAGLPPDQAAHLQIEALKLAFADAAAYVAEPGAMPFGADSLLDPGYLAERRSLIGQCALVPAAGSPDRGGTVYLATADANGCMVSYIQSNYMGFGSGIVVPGTGIALHNRGHNFSTRAGHPNMLEPGKRPYHTIIPGFLTKDDAAVGPFGVMGGFMQPQGHLQVLVHALKHGRNPQEALDAPRFQWTQGLAVQVEADYDSSLVEALLARGHDITVERDAGTFGRGQIIWRDGTGVLCGATEKRTDGCVAAF